MEIVARDFSYIVILVQSWALYSKPPISDEAIWEVFARFRVHGIGSKPILALWIAKILTFVGKDFSPLKN